MRILLAATFLCLPALLLAQQPIQRQAPDFLSPNLLRSLKKNAEIKDPLLKNLQQSQRLMSMLSAKSDGQTVCSVPLREMEIPKDREFTVLVIRPPRDVEENSSASLIKPPAPPCDMAASDKIAAFPREKR